MPLFQILNLSGGRSLVSGGIGLHTQLLPVPLFHDASGETTVGRSIYTIDYGKFKNLKKRHLADFSQDATGKTASWPGAPPNSAALFSSWVASSFYAI